MPLGLTTILSCTHRHAALLKAGKWQHLLSKLSTIDFIKLGCSDDEVACLRDATEATELAGAQAPQSQWHLYKYIALFILTACSVYLWHNRKQRRAGQHLRA